MRKRGMRLASTTTRMIGGTMKQIPIAAAAIVALAAATATPAAEDKWPTQGPGVQARQDAREPAVLARCKSPPLSNQLHTFNRSKHRLRTTGDSTANLVNQQYVPPFVSWKVPALTQGPFFLAGILLSLGLFGRFQPSSQLRLALVRCRILRVFS